MIRVDTCGINIRISYIVEDHVRPHASTLELRKQRPYQACLPGSKEPSDEQKRSGRRHASPRSELRRIGRISVDSLGIKRLFSFDKTKSWTLLFINDFSIETAPIANVAGRLFASSIRAGQRYLQDKAVLIIIDQDSLNILTHPRRLPFLPEFLP